MKYKDEQKNSFVLITIAFISVLFGMVIQRVVAPYSYYYTILQVVAGVIVLFFSYIILRRESRPTLDLVTFLFYLIWGVLYAVVGIPTYMQAVSHTFNWVYYSSLEYYEAGVRIALYIVLIAIWIVTILQFIAVIFTMVKKKTKFVEITSSISAFAYFVGIILVICSCCFECAILSETPRMYLQESYDSLYSEAIGACVVSLLISYVPGLLVNCALLSTVNNIAVNSRE